MFRMLTNRLLFLCLLFSVGTESLYAQQIETSHIRFLKRLAAGIERGELEGKSVRQFMLEERIAFVEGDLSMLESLLADSTAMTEIAIVDGKRCAASFYKDSVRVFTITYPADYQLILGVTLMEAEDYLCDAVVGTPLPSLVTTFVSRDLLIQQGNSLIYVKPGCNYIIPELNSNRYYVAVKNNNTVATDTSSSLLLVEKRESDSTFYNEVDDSVNAKTLKLLSLSKKKRECWLLSFIKRIFGCSGSNCQGTENQCVDDSVTSSDTLTFLGDSLEFELLYSEDMPIESMANLVTGTDIDDSISIDILLVKYGYRTEQFTVPLRQWITFCIAEGCQPYFGVISQDSSEVVCELIMHNELFGYAHVMKLTFNPIIIAQRKGIVKARLNSYVPINNLKSLFDEDE